MEKKNKAKYILKRKSSKLLISWVYCQTFTKTVMKTLYVNSVV